MGDFNEPEVHKRNNWTRCNRVQNCEWFRENIRCEKNRRRCQVCISEGALPERSLRICHDTTKNSSLIDVDCLYCLLKLRIRDVRLHVWMFNSGTIIYTPITTQIKIAGTGYIVMFDKNNTFTIAWKRHKICGKKSHERWPMHFQSMQFMKAMLN